MACNCNKNKKEIPARETNQYEIERLLREAVESDEYFKDKNVQISSTGNSSGCGFTVKANPVFSKVDKIEVKVKCEKEFYHKDIKAAYYTHAGKPVAGMYNPPTLPCPSGCAYNPRTRCSRISDKTVAQEVGEKKIFSIGEKNVIAADTGPRSGGVVSVDDRCGSCDTRSNYKVCMNVIPMQSTSSTRVCETTGNCKSGTRLCNDARTAAETKVEEGLKKLREDHDKKIEDAKKELTDKVNKAIEKANKDSKITSTKKPSEQQIRNHIINSWKGCSQAININWNANSEWKKSNKAKEKCDDKSMDQSSTTATVGTSGEQTESGFKSDCPKDSCTGNKDCQGASNSTNSMVGAVNLHEIFKYM